MRRFFLFACYHSSPFGLRQYWDLDLVLDLIDSSSCLFSCLSFCSCLSLLRVSVLSRTNKACSTIISGYSYDTSTVVVGIWMEHRFPLIARSLHLVSIQFDLSIRTVMRSHMCDRGASGSSATAVAAGVHAPSADDSNLISHA